MVPFIPVLGITWFITPLGVVGLEFLVYGEESFLQRFGVFLKQALVCPLVFMRRVIPARGSYLEKLFVSLLAFASLPLFACAFDKPPQVCKVSFSVVYLDRLNNYNVGVPAKSLKDIQSRLSKFGDVCYQADQKGDLVFFIHTTPAVYHGHRVYTNNSSAAAAATNGNGDAAAAAASSSSTTAVPYDVDYSVFILDVELPGADGNSRVLRTFDQKALFHTIYGIGYGKGKHPIPNVIEAAAGWVHESFNTADLEAAKAMKPAVQTVAESPTAQMANLSVESSVAGADIEVDGTFVGNTPSTVSITPGQHMISVKLKGYAVWSRAMNVSGTGVRLNADLKATP